MRATSASRRDRTGRAGGGRARPRGRAGRARAAHRRSRASSRSGRVELTPGSRPSGDISPRTRRRGGIRPRGRSHPRGLAVVGRDRGRQRASRSGRRRFACSRSSGSARSATASRSPSCTPPPTWPATVPICGCSVELDLTLVALRRLARPRGRTAACGRGRWRTLSELRDPTLLSTALGREKARRGLPARRRRRRTSASRGRSSSRISMTDSRDRAEADARSPAFSPFYAGDFERARTLLYPLRARLLERGEDTDLPLLSMHLAWLECLAGDLGAATGARRRGHSRPQPWAARWMAHALALSAVLDAHAGAAERCRERVAAALSTRWAMRSSASSSSGSAIALGLLEQSRSATHAATLRALEPVTEFFAVAGARRTEPPLASSQTRSRRSSRSGELERAEQLTESAALERRRPRPPLGARRRAKRCSALVLGCTTRAHGCARDGGRRARRARTRADAARACAHVDGRRAGSSGA